MSEHNVKTIDVHELKKRLHDNHDLCLIDVREMHEWETSHIREAKHIPKGDLTALIATEVPNKSTPVYLHCHAGIRSLQAAHLLQQLGYSEVYSIEGGLAKWIMAGYPVVH